MDLENLVSRSKWQEEEADPEDVKDNWEDEDEEPPKPASNEAAKKLTGGTRNKRAPGKAGNSANTEASDKALLEKMQKETEMKLSRQMFGMEDKDIALEFPLETKEDFDKFHKNLVQKLWCYDKSPNYYLLLDKLFRDLCVPLEADELKNLSSTINALFNEKVKVAKGKPKKKAGKGLAIKMERNNMDRDEDLYDDGLDDIM